MLKDYDLQIQYDPAKANGVGDAQSKEAQHSLSTIMITKLNLLREPEDLGVQLVSHRLAITQMSTVTLQPSAIEEIRVNQEDDTKLQRIKQNLKRGKSLAFVVYEDGTL